MKYIRPSYDDEKLDELKSLAQLTGNKNLAELLAYGDVYTRFPKELNEFNNNREDGELRGVLHVDTNILTGQVSFNAVDIHGEMNPVDRFVTAVHEATHLKWRKDNPYLDHIMTLDSRYLYKRADELNARHHEAIAFLQYYQIRPITSRDMMSTILRREDSIGTLGTAIDYVINDRKPKRKSHDTINVFNQVSQKELSTEDMMRIKAHHILYMMDREFVGRYFYGHHDDSKEHAEDAEKLMNNNKRIWRRAKPFLMKTMMVAHCNMDHIFTILNEDDKAEPFTSSLDKRTIDEITKTLPRLTREQRCLNRGLKDYNKKLRNNLRAL